MNIKAIKVGFLQTNCYILTIDNKCLIVDPGDEPEKILKEVDDNELLGILITHHHPDHIGALETLIKQYNVPIYDKKVTSEQNYQIDKFNFEVIYTPGHTDDSITFYFEEEQVMFTGDFLFKDTIGRTDLPTGDYNIMLESIQKIKHYSSNIKICPGHGDVSTLEEEFKYNIYLQ